MEINKMILNNPTYYYFIAVYFTVIFAVLYSKTMMDKSWNIYIIWVLITIPYLAYPWQLAMMSTLLGAKVAFIVIMLFLIKILKER